MNGTRNGFRCESLAMRILKQSGIHLFLLLAIFSITVSGAKAQEIRDSMNRLVFRISDNGEVRSSQNVLLWRLQGDGAVTSSQNLLLMRLKKDGKVVSGRNRILGRIDQDGTVWSPMNRKMGIVNAEGRIIDSQNVLLGKATGIDREQAALIWFFLRPQEENEGSPSR